VSCAEGLPALTTQGAEARDEIAVLHELSEHLQRCVVSLRFLLWGGRTIGNDLAAFDLRFAADVEPLAAGASVRVGPFRTAWKVASRPAGAEPADILLANANAVPRRTCIAALETLAGFPFGYSGLDRPPLFHWFRFTPLDFLESHKPIEDEFRDRTGCALLAIVYVMACLALRSVRRWRSSSAELASQWQYAIEIADTDSLRTQLRQLRGEAEALIFRDRPISEQEFEDAIDFQTLNSVARGTMDVLIGQPLFCLMPWGATNMVIDHGWGLRRLDRLFARVRAEETRFWS
jgi:hypothetical protein